MLGFAEPVREGFIMNILKADTGRDKIKADIYRQIQRGHLKKNDRLFSEENLAKHYGIGIKIVRRTLSELENEGVVIRKKRVGTFINNPNISGTTHISVLHFDMTAASAYTAEMFRGIEDGLRGLNCSMQINPIQGRRIAGSRRTLLYDLIFESKIGGLLLLSWLEKDEIEMLLEKNIPLVVAGFEYRDLDVPTVLDDIRGMLDRTIAELLASGHERIGMITGTTGVLNPDVIMAQEKLLSEYEKVTAAKGIFHPELLKQGLFTERDGYWLMQDLLMRKDYPTAVIACGNDLANGALKAIYEYGKGKKVTLFPLADREDMLPKPLMKRPISKIGETAANMLNDIMERRELKARKIYLDSELIR